MSGLYNAIHGWNPACYLLAPMLTGGQKPTEFFPRFRDCYALPGRIAVYTRVGGANRSYERDGHHAVLPWYDEGCDFHENRLYAMDTFLETWDDPFDSTYGTYVFSVPPEWREDYDKVMHGILTEPSDGYAALIDGCWGEHPFFSADVPEEKLGKWCGILMSAPDWEGTFEKMGAL